MIVIPISTFLELYKIGVQIEDAMKQGLLADEREQVKRPFVRNSNAASGSTTTRPDVSVVATTNTADPFANTVPQPSANPVRSYRTFTQLYMTLSQAIKVLIKKGHLKPLESRSLPDPLPPKHDLAKYCAFHQQHGHDTDQCFRLCYEIQDLIDNKVIAPPEKPNTTTNPLPTHNQVPPPRNLNLIHTLAIPYDPSIYITPSHLSKPTLFIPESTDLCMMDTSNHPSNHQPKLVVTLTVNRKSTLEEGTSSLPESSKDLSGGMYDPSYYIVLIVQIKPELVLPTAVEVNVVRAGGPYQDLDDLAELEEDLDNLKFFDE
ncbi:hypothetical protein CsSME_00048057 [Camellia sinensis var. sinensis]